MKTALDLADLPTSDILFDSGSVVKGGSSDGPILATQNVEPPSPKMQEYIARFVADLETCGPAGLVISVNGPWRPLERIIRACEHAQLRPQLEKKLQKVVAMSKVERIDHEKGILIPARGQFNNDYDFECTARVFRYLSQRIPMVIVSAVATSALQIPMSVMQEIFKMDGAVQWILQEQLSTNKLQFEQACGPEEKRFRKGLDCFEWCRSFTTLNGNCEGKERRQDLDGGRPRWDHIIPFVRFYPHDVITVAAFLEPQLMKQCYRPKLEVLNGISHELIGYKDSKGQPVPGIIREEVEGFIVAALKYTGMRRSSALENMIRRISFGKLSIWWKSTAMKRWISV